MKRIWNRPWFRIFFAYLILGTVYIYFSDKLVSLLITDKETITHVQTFKGWLFIVVSGLFIAWLVLRETHKQDTLNEQLTNSVERLRVMNSALDSARKVAEENDRLKTAFLNNMSHEIRTPLNGIIGFSGLLTDEELTSGKREKYAGIIRSSGKQLIRLIDDILDISRIEAGQLHLINEDFDIGELIETVAALAREKIRNMEKNVTVDVELDFGEKSTLVCYDKHRIMQILVNLTDNAAKYTAEGRIHIGCHCPYDRLILTVEDTGTGIDAGDRDKIFKRFYQGHNEEISAAGGTGIGLSVVEGLVHLLNGEITVESEAGKGSRFTVTIPYIKSGQETKMEAQNSEMIRFMGKTVLIADDVATSSELLKEILEGVGMKVYLAENGSESLERFKDDNTIDIVLLDIRMPVMNGYEAVGRMKTLRPRIPVIAQTAHAMQYDREKALASGFDDYIAKPISRKVLLNMFNKYL